MIHDLDLMLLLVHSRIARIDAVGVPVLSPSEDIANARVQFAGGCIANLTASRISDESIRRIRVFQEDSYLSIDYQAQTVELACLRPRRPAALLRPQKSQSDFGDSVPDMLRMSRGKAKHAGRSIGGRQARKRGTAIRRINLPVNQRPPLQDELASFVRAITTKRPPVVSGADGRAALALALRIEQTMRRSRMRSAEFGVRSSKFGVRSSECGV
jgi:predicted dehydrogenase